MRLANIQDEANKFTALLDNTLEHALGLRNQFEMPRELKDKDNNPTGIFSIALKEQPSTKTREIPLKRKCDRSNKPALFLGIAYTVNINPESQYLQVLASSTSLYVRIPYKGRNKRPVPVVRAEYLRDRSVSAAHLHIHATSPELAWIYGTARKPVHPLQDLHLPVGDKRFRPTLEEFLFFLNDEKLFTDWQDGWKQHVNITYGKWKSTQAKSVVRAYQTEAVEELETLGYKVIPPDK